MKGKILDISTIGEERKRKKQKWIIVGAVACVGTLFLFLVWIVRWSGVFSVREVAVEGVNYVSPDYVRGVVTSQILSDAERWKLFFGIHHMWAWPDVLHGTSLLVAPEIKKITVEKNYEDRRVTLRVEERRRAGVWCFNAGGESECVWFDEDGVALRRAFSGEGSLIVVVYDYAQKKVSLGERVLEARLFQNLRSAIEAIQSSELRMKEIRIEDLAREEVVVTTHDGPNIMASMRFPLGGVSEAIDVIKKQKALSALEYIDFRVEGRVYYR